MLSKLYVLYDIIVFFAFYVTTLHFIECDFFKQATIQQAYDIIYTAGSSSAW